MTVEQLIEKLKALPPKCPVHLRVDDLRTECEKVEIDPKTWAEVILS